MMFTSKTDRPRDFLMLLPDDTSSVVPADDEMTNLLKQVARSAVRPQGTVQ